MNQKIIAIIIAVIVVIGVAAVGARQYLTTSSPPQPTPTPTPTATPAPTETATAQPTPTPTPFLYPAHFNFNYSDPVQNATYSPDPQDHKNDYWLQGTIFCAGAAVMGAHIDLVNVNTGQVISSTSEYGSFGEFDFYLPADTPATTAQLVFNGNAQAAACTSNSFQIP